jgi:excisionase family DNA binding protein
LRLLTIAQAAEMLALSESSVRRIIRRGELREIRPTSKAIRVEEGDVIRFIAERTCSSGLPAGPERGAWGGGPSNGPSVLQLLRPNLAD